MNGKNGFVFLVVAVIALAVLACGVVQASAPGALVAWGYSRDGLCTVPPGHDFVAVAAGGSHSVAIRSDGSLVAWGDNNWGQCDVPAGNDYVAVSCGHGHSLALRSNGSLVAWGYGPWGQIDVPAGTNYKFIAAGGYHSLAIRTDGSIAAWGENSFGQLSVPSGNFVAVDGGDTHNVALKSDGSLVTWGSYLYGGGPFPAPADNDYVAVAAKLDHSLALKSDGSIVAWGWNDDGQCDFPAGNDYLAVSGGYYHSLALKSDGSIVAWGRNDYGQIDVPDGHYFVAVAGGGDHSVGIATQSAPVNETLSPSGGSLATGVKSLEGVYSDLEGYTDIKRAYLLINDSLTQANAAMLMYDRTTNKLFLKNDANSGWSTGYAPGTDIILQNSQCYVYVKNTAVSGSGNDLTVTWSVELKAPFSAKNLNGYMYAQDSTNRTDGWDKKGIYNNVKPQVVSIDPSGPPLEALVKKTLTSVYRDPNGAGDIRKCYLLVNDTTLQSGAMFIWYDCASNKIYLKNTANTNWGTGYVLGADITLSNNQCLVYVKDTTVTKSGTDVTVNWSIQIKSAFSKKNLYAWMYVTDSKGAYDGWKKVGTYFNLIAPTCDSIAPSSGKVTTGVPQTFIANYSDGNGFANISQCYLQIGQTGCLANTICVLYDAIQNKVFLRDDANTAWSTGYPPATDVVLENSQCKVYVKNTSAISSGLNGLTLTWSIELKPSQIGKLLGERMFCRDNEYLDSDWKLKGYIRGQ